ncbi:MAG: VTT domain-containing protein [Desulfuromonadales bacterium]
MVWTNLWASLLHWVTAHPEATYLLVLLISLSESLALIGLLVPGTVMMIGIGALAGTGAISVNLTLLAAFAGAVAGDGLSYWLGRHYHQGLKRRWPFCRYPKILSRGEEFFLRHGGKSVFLGRFVGPVRAVVPVIAGMLDMPVRQFVLVNVFSAIGWALAYILPGVALAGSLALIGAVSARLSLLLLLLVILFWLTFWLCRKAFVLLGRLGPEKERFLLPILCLTLVVAGWVFLGVLEDLVHGDPLVLVDQAVYQFLQALRTQWGDQVLVVVTELGDGVVNIAIASAVLLALLFRRQFRAAGFWLLALSGAAGLVQLFKLTLHRPRPIDVYQGVASWGFPSGHTTMSVVLYGFLAILLVRRFKPGHRWLPFGFAIGMSMLIAFSRLYLGAHWLSDVLGGLALGWAWVTFLGIIFLRRPEAAPSRVALLIPALLVMVLTGAWHARSQHASDLVRYQPQRAVQRISAGDWREMSWQELPGWRIDLAGEVEQPLSLQWAGDPDHLAAVLTGHGWSRTDSFDYKQLLNLLVPRAKIQQLPLLPQMENGRQERILMLMPKDEKRLVLRLWPTDFRLSDFDQELWVGTVDFEYAYPMATLMTLPRGSGHYAAALALLLESLNADLDVHWGQQPLPGEPLASGWDGKTLLLTAGSLSLPVN